ncbi:MAG: PQQ-binding-like beta-propeller repeat protein, partial [Armatimonadetes bacterium]|nr:PQQ-binding-like beta-propeller repeat protein [Armatimonadota bacterium]
MKVHAARPWQTRPIAAGTGPKPEPADTSVSGSAPDLVQAFENVARQSSVRWRSQPVGLHRGSPLALGPRTISNVTPPHEFRTHLLALGPDGAATWRSDVPTNMNASPIADSHGRIYIGTPRGLACLDGDTGGALWETEEYPMTRLCPRGTVEWSTEGGMGRPVLSRDEKTVYFPLLEGVVVALSTEDGSLQWHAARPGQQESSRGPPARPHRAVGTKQRLGWRGQARHPQSLHQLQIDPQRRVLGKTAVKREIDPLLGAARE